MESKIDLASGLAAFIKACEAEIEEEKSKCRDQIEDAYRRGKAEGYRAALLDFEDGLSESGATAKDIYESGYRKGLEYASKNDKLPALNLKVYGISRANVVSAITAICKEFGYCPSILGWEDYKDCGGRAELCEGCWKMARQKAENYKGE